MRDNDIVFFNLHRNYLDHNQEYGGFLGIYLLAAFVNANGYQGQAFAGTLHQGKVLIDEICKAQKTKIIGLYCDYANVTENSKIARYIKEKYHLPILIGGPQSNSLNGQFLEDSGIDVIVRGEGELTVSALLDYYLDDTGSLAQIEGIAYLSGNQFLQTSDRPPIENLDALPWIDEECYLIPRKDWHELDIMTGRGCPFTCAFCHEADHTKGVRFRSVENVLAEIDAFFTRHSFSKTPYIMFTDDAFTLNPERVHKICEGLALRKKKWGFQWFCEGHIHTLAQHPEMIQDMAKAGMQRIQLGIEAGTEQVLKSYRKNTDPEEIKKVVAICRDAGIQQIYGNIILGSAFFSRETFQKDLAFGKELLHLGKGTLELGVVTYWPLPGTSMTDYPEKYQIKIVDKEFQTSVDDFPQTETAELKRHQILQFVQKMEQEFTEVRKTMLLHGEVPMERILSWYPSSSVFKSYGLWWKTLCELPHLQAYGHLLLKQDGMTGKEAAIMGKKAHPMRLLPLIGCLQWDGCTGRIANQELTLQETETLILCTGRMNCEEIFANLKERGILKGYDEVENIFHRLEKAYLIIYSNEWED